MWQTGCLQAPRKPLDRDMAACNYSRSGSCFYFSPSKGCLRTACTAGLFLILAIAKYSDSGLAIWYHHHSLLASGTSIYQGQEALRFSLGSFAFFLDYLESIPFWRGTATENPGGHRIWIVIWTSKAVHCELRL